MVIQRKTADALARALEGALSDLEAWAGAGPEGMTLEERRRVRGYERTLDRYRNRNA